MPDVSRPVTETRADHGTDMVPRAPWRTGSHYGIQVYEGDRPVATFHTVADAHCAVVAYNEADELRIRAERAVAALAAAEQERDEARAACEQGATSIRKAAAIGAERDRLAEALAEIEQLCNETTRELPCIQTGCDCGDYFDAVMCVDVRCVIDGVLRRALAGQSQEPEGSSDG